MFSDRIISILLVAHVYANTAVSASCQGRSQRAGRGHGPQSSIEWIFTEKNWHYSLYQKCSVGLKYAKKCVGGLGLRPGPRWGSSRRSLRPHSRLRRGTPPPQSPSFRRFRRLDSRAFGTQLLCRPM